MKEHRPLKNLQLVSKDLHLPYSCIVALMLCCSPKSDDDAASTSPESNPTGTILVDSDLTRTVPKDLAVTSVTQQVSSDLLATGQIQITGTSGLAKGSSDTEDYYIRTELLKKVASSTDTADCTLAIPTETNIAQGGLGHAPCFGPAIDFTNHPGTMSSGSVGNGDFGIFTKYENINISTGPACSSIVMNNLVQNTSFYANTATGLVAAAACLGRIQGLNLPEEVGDSIDLSSLASVVNKEREGLVIKKIELLNSENLADDSSVYLYKFSGSLLDKARDLDKEFILSVEHIPKNTENTEYAGTIQYRIFDFEDNRDAAISIKYQWASKKLRYRLRQLQVPSETENIFGADSGEVDSSVTGQGYIDILANLNSLGLGKLSYVWDTFDLLVFNAETKEDGTGIAYFGHRSKDNTIKGSSESYSIQGLRCYPMNPPLQGFDTYSSKVQSQTLQINANGQWEPKVSRITYAPTGSCSWDSNNDPGQTASFTAKVEQGGPGSEQSVAFPYPTIADLLEYSAYQDAWEAPQPPE